jgi:hypothetical protein
MVLKPKRPTLAKTALGWGTLKFRYVRTQRWTTPLGRFCNIGNTSRLSTNYSPRQTVATVSGLWTARSAVLC